MNVNANFKVLGLSSDASWDDVKSAFRRLARTYHPDVAGPESARKFTEITEAYMTLKEAISPGAARSGRAHYPPRDADVEDAPKKESFFKALWRKIVSFQLFSWKSKQEVTEEVFEDIPPARVRFIGSIISRAESEIHAILSRRSEVVERNRTDAILRRLKSRHPGVVLLALKRISMRNITDEMRLALIEHFKKSTPTSEVLESVLMLFSGMPGSGELAKVLSRHADDFSHSDAMMVLKWFKRNAATKDCYAAFLNHGSDAVIAAAIGSWPLKEGLPETSDISNMLKKDSDIVLVPLLRLLKKEKLPIWILQVVDRIMKEHKSAAVRVWASAIVRDRNLS